MGRTFGAELNNEMRSLVIRCGGFSFLAALGVTAWIFGRYWRYLNGHWVLLNAPSDANPAWLVLKAASFFSYLFTRNPPQDESILGAWFGSVLFCSIPLFVGSFLAGLWIRPQHRHQS